MNDVSQLNATIPADLHRRLSALVGRFNEPPFHITMSSVVSSAVTRECDRLEALLGGPIGVLLPRGNESSDEYMTSTEASKALKIPIHQVRFRIHSGALKATRSGRNWKVSRKHVQQLLNGK